MTAPHFSSDRHAIGFTVALFGLAVFQSVQLLLPGTPAPQSAELTGAVVPPILRENIDATDARGDAQQGRIRSERMLREQLKKNAAAAEEARKKRDAAASAAAAGGEESTSCDTVRALAQELSCRSW